MSRGRVAVLTIVMVALAAAAIGLVASVLARAVQEKAPLPPLYGQASPMAPTERPTIEVVGVNPSGDTPASIRATGLLLIDRHGVRRASCLFPLHPSFVALDLRAHARGRS